MPPKRRRSTGAPTSKRAKRVNIRTSATVNNSIVLPTASADQLLSLTTKVLRSHLQAYSLPTTGNKATLADRLYQHFHTSSQQVSNSSSSETDVSAPPPPTTGSTENPPLTDRGLQLPQQFADQLSDFIHRFVPTSGASMVITTSKHQPPRTTGNDLQSTSTQLLTTVSSSRPNDEVLSTASPVQLLSPGTGVNYHATTTITNSTPTLINHTTNVLPPLVNQPSVGYNPTIITNPLTQYLPPVPSRIRERIIKGEFIDFVTLLPKAMFS